MMLNPGVLDRPVSVPYMDCADIRLTIEGGLSAPLPRDRKAPTLRGMYDQVLYFHDGRFDHLEDAVAYMNDYLELGISVADRQAVTEFLRRR